MVCDRFTDSTIAYQGAGRGLGAAAITELHRIACGDLFPHLTFLLDIDMATSLLRARIRNQAAASPETRLDDEGCLFFERVRDAYRALAASEPNRIRVIDARDSVGVVAARIWEETRLYV